MTTDRRGYQLALAVAVVALLASIGLAPAASTARAGRAGQDTEARAGWGAGMMGSDGGTGPVSRYAARTLAQAWVARNLPGSDVDEGTSMPMGHRFTVTRDNRIVAVIMVDDDTGRVAVHRWDAPVPSASGRD
jgi:hypothetical protein